MGYGSSTYGSDSYGGFNNSVKRQSITYTLNAVLLKTFSNTFALDAFLVYCTSPGGSSVTIIRNHFPFTFNAYIKKTINTTFTLDASLNINSTKVITFSINSYLQKTIISQFTLDAFIVYNTSRCPGAASDDITTGSIYATDGIKNW